MLRPTSSLLAIAVPVLIASASAQQTSPTGFGRIMFPGTGGPTAPPRGSGLGPGLSGNTTPGGFGRMVYPGTGAPVALRPGIPNPVFVAPQVPISHRAHGRSTLVPFPVFYGGGYYGSYDVPDAATPGTEIDPNVPNQRAPVVIINQNFQPDTVSSTTPSAASRPSPRRSEPAPAPPPETAIVSEPRREAKDEEPTIYLIAMADSTVIDALAYWVETGDTLSYITREGSPNRVSLALVDRERSTRLNTERKVEFKLPKR